MDMAINLTVFLSSHWYAQYSSWRLLNYYTVHTNGMMLNYKSLQDVLKFSLTMIWAIMNCFSSQLHITAGCSLNFLDWYELWCRVSMHHLRWTAKQWSLMRTEWWISQIQSTGTSTAPCTLWGALHRLVPCPDSHQQNGVDWTHRSQPPSTQPRTWSMWRRSKLVSSFDPVIQEHWNLWWDTLVTNSGKLTYQRQSSKYSVTINGRVNATTCPAQIYHFAWLSCMWNVIECSDKHNGSSVNPARSLPTLPCVHFTWYKYPVPGPVLGVQPNAVHRPKPQVGQRVWIILRLHERCTTLMQALYVCLERWQVNLTSTMPIVAR